jgi:hypothetical protein
MFLPDWTTWSGKKLDISKRDDHGEIHNGQSSTTQTTMSPARAASRSLNDTKLLYLSQIGDALKASFEYETEKRKRIVKNVLAGPRAFVGTSELAETIMFNYTSAKASLETLTEDQASDVAVRLAEAKANPTVLSCQRMISTPSRLQVETAEELVVERLVKTNLPRLPSGPTAIIDQVAYEFHKQAPAIWTETLLRGTGNAKSTVDEALAEARAKILTLTAELAQASPTHHRNTAAIVGGVAGGGGDLRPRAHRLRCISPCPSTSSSTGANSRSEGYRRTFRSSKKR